jgi:hypothetical protein
LLLAAGVLTNGNSGSNVIQLEMQYRNLGPDDMDDGETFADGEWIDKSGNGNNSLYTQNIELMHQSTA